MLQGTAALAGYGMGARLEYLQIPLVFGFGSALVAMVGTNVGAGRLARAERIAWVGAGIAAGVTTAIGVTGALAPWLWLGMFSTDPSVLITGAMYLWIVGPFYGFFGLGLALYFASQGAGRLAWPLIAGLARLLVAAVGGWLAVHYLDAGLSGLFVAMALALVLFGVTVAGAVRAGPRHLSSIRRHPGRGRRQRKRHEHQAGDQESRASGHRLLQAIDGRPLRRPQEDAGAASLPSARRTSLKEAMATSIWLRSGGLVVIFWSHRPGAISARMTRESGNRAPSRRASNASPAMMGMARTRDPMRHQIPGVPNRANTKMVRTMTMRRKFVPHRTWRVEYRSTLPGSNRSSCS